MTIDRRSSAAPVQHNVAMRAFACARAAACVMLMALALPALAQEAPDALVKRVSQEALQIIKTDPKVQAGDQARIRDARPFGMRAGQEEDAVRLVAR